MLRRLLLWSCRLALIGFFCVAPLVSALGWNLLWVVAAGISIYGVIEGVREGLIRRYIRIVWVVEHDLILRAVAASTKAGIR